MGTMETKPACSLLALATAVRMEPAQTTTGPCTPIEKAAMPQECQRKRPTTTILITFIVPHLATLPLHTTSSFALRWTKLKGGSTTWMTAWMKKRNDTIALEKVEMCRRAPIIPTEVTRRKWTRTWTTTWSLRETAQSLAGLLFMSDGEQRREKANRGAKMKEAGSLRQLPPNTFEIPTTHIRLTPNY